MNKREEIYVTSSKHVGDQPIRIYTLDNGDIWLWLGNHHALSFSPSAAEEIIALLQHELAKAKVTA